MNFRKLPARIPKPLDLPDEDMVGRFRTMGSEGSWAKVYVMKSGKKYAWGTVTPQKPHEFYSVASLRSESRGGAVKRSLDILQRHADNGFDVEVVEGLTDE